MFRQLIFAFFVFISFLSTAQTFAPIGAKWHYDYQYLNSFAKGYVLYESVGDTTVANLTCRHLRKTIFHEDGSIAPDTSFFVRQAGDTVYYFNYVYQRFFPLIYLNVKIGDSLNFHSPYVPKNARDTLWYAKVRDVFDYVDSANNSDTFRHVSLEYNSYSLFEFQSGFYDEKMGTEPRMLGHFYKILTPVEGEWRLRCYSDSNVKLTGKIPCDFKRSAGLNDLEYFETKIFPVPAVDFLQIEVETEKQVSFSLINVLGEELMQGAFVTSTSISLSHIPVGVYFLELKSEGKAVRKKIVVGR